MVVKYLLAGTTVAISSLALLVYVWPRLRGGKGAPIRVLLLALAGFGAAVATVLDRRDEAMYLFLVCFVLSLGDEFWHRLRPGKHDNG